MVLSMAQITTEAKPSRDKREQRLPSRSRHHKELKETSSKTLWPAELTRQLTLRLRVN